MKATTKDVQAVFEAWRKYQANPKICRLTDSRKKLIRARLKEFEPDDLILLIEYVFEGQDGFCKWMRGDNPSKRKYLDLANLFRTTKAAARVEQAYEWKQNLQAKQGESNNSGLDLGFMGAIRGVKS